LLVSTQHSGSYDHRLANERGVSFSAETCLISVIDPRDKEMELWYRHNFLIDFPIRREEEKMKLKLKMCMAIAAAAIITGQTVVHAEEAEKPTASVDLGVFSQYIWRGFELSHDSLVIQPSVTLGYKGVSLNVWGNLDTDNDAYNGAKYNETDITLSYSKSIGMVKMTGGYIYYALDSAQDSQEIFGSVGLNVFLNPTITIYREIASMPAWYVNVGVSHSVELANKITLDLAASAGYYYSDDSDFSEVKDPSSKYRELHNGLMSVGFTIPVGDYFSIKPMLAYSFPLSSKAEDLIKTGPSDKSNFLYGGVTLSMAF
jgi:hypothetical protein